MIDRPLTVPEVATLMRVSAKTVMRAIMAGHLEASQITQGRGGWRITESAVERWMDVRSNLARALRESRPLANIPAAPGAGVPRRRMSSRTPGGRLPIDEAA
jgi:excisionase family DNA binding protein